MNQTLPNAFSKDVWDLENIQVYEPFYHSTNNEHMQTDISYLLILKHDHVVHDILHYENKPKIIRIGVAKRCESILSNIPPCPGSIVPVSLMSDFLLK